MGNEMADNVHDSAMGGVIYFNFGGNYPVRQGNL